MAKLIYTVLMSLDGYIADKSGNLVFAGDLTTEVRPGRCRFCGESNAMMFSVGTGCSAF
jgi:hypothetical protein